MPCNKTDNGFASDSSKVSGEPSSHSMPTLLRHQANCDLTTESHPWASSFREPDFYDQVLVDRHRLKRDKPRQHTMLQNCLLTEPFPPAPWWTQSNSANVRTERSDVPISPTAISFRNSAVARPLWNSACILSCPHRNRSITHNRVREAFAVAHQKTEQRQEHKLIFVPCMISGSNLPLSEQHTASSVFGLKDVLFCSGSVTRRDAR